MSDIRPANCRFRLRDEGKPYPRSSCVGCGRSVTTGLGTRCHIETEALAKLAPEQEVCDHKWVQDICPDQHVPTSGTYCSKCGADPSEPGFAEADELARLRKAVRQSEATLERVRQIVSETLGGKDLSHPTLWAALDSIHEVIAPADAKGGDGE